MLALGIVVALGVWWYMAKPPVPSEETIASITEVKDERLSKGEKDAPVQMIEYVDMFCPSCARAHQDVIPKIQSEYIDTGKLYYEVRIVAKIQHDDAQVAADGAYCAAEQGKFWDYIDLAYGETAKLYQAGKSAEDITLFSGVNVRNFAREVGVNVPRWENCVKNQTYQDVIGMNEQKMRDLGAYGTPHSVINGENYTGAPPYQTFKTVIEAALDKTEKQKSKGKP